MGGGQETRRLAQRHDGNLQKYRFAALQLPQSPQPSAAEAVWVRNLVLLQQAAGGDVNLAEAVELSPRRVYELVHGITPFGPELASHIEEALQLPPRWMDQPRNGSLHDIPAEVLSRLRRQQAPQEVKMDKAHTAESPAETNTAVEDRRRQNFALLTGAKGAKKIVAGMLELTPSSITFLANGEKRFTDAVARTLEKKLGLKSGWLDKRHTYGTVPAEVWKKLGDPKVAPARSRVGPLKALAVSVPQPPSRQKLRPLMTREELLRRLDANLPLASTAKPQATAAPGTNGHADDARELPPHSVQTTPTPHGSSAVQPVARALVETIETMSAKGELTEARALKILNELLSA